MAPRTAAQPFVDEACPDGNWGPAAVADSADASSEEPLQPMSMMQLLGAVCGLVAALPAIIGAWCWPMVVAALFNVGASVMNGGSGTGIVDFFHGLQVAIMLTLMFNLTQFVWWTCKRMRPEGTFWARQGPTVITLFSAILVNIQPMMILIIGSWKICCNTCTGFGLPSNCTSTSMTYSPWPRTPTTGRECSTGGNVFWDMSYCSGGNYAVFPTVWKGWLIQVVCTWGGYILMFVGVFQATRLHVKLAKKWSAIRRGTRG